MHRSYGPAFSRGLLQVVGRKLEDKATLLTSENKSLSDDIDTLKVAAQNHEYETSVMQSDLRLIRKKLNNIHILTKRRHSSLSGTGGRGKIDEAALDGELNSILQILLPYIEAETQEWVEEYPNRPPEWVSGDGWNE